MDDRPTLRVGLEVIAGGDGDAQVIAQQTLDANPIESCPHHQLAIARESLETISTGWSYPPNGMTEPRYLSHERTARQALKQMDQDNG